MHNIKYQLIASIAALSLSACHFNSIRTNMATDKKDAEMVADKFHELIKAKNYDAIYPLFSKTFFKTAKKTKLTETLTGIQNKLGDLKSDSLIAWKTKIVEGANPFSRYVLKYLNHQQKYDSTEQFILHKDKDGIIRIVGYSVNSKGFL